MHNAATTARFATWTEKDHLIESYVDACWSTSRCAQRSGELGVVDTVFIGGGTPSLIGAPHLARLICAIEVCAGAEITVECNPESTDEALLDGLLAAGVTRISLGIQTLQEHVLAGLGR